MLKAFLQRRRTRKTLEQYVSPEVAGQIDGGSLLSPAAPTIERNIEVVFVALFAPDASAYSERAGALVKLVVEHGGIVHALLPVAVITFGSVVAVSPDARFNFVAALKSRIVDAAIVHGSITAQLGSFGSKEFEQFGFWWPGMLDALRQLATLSPGDTCELASSRGGG